MRSASTSVLRLASFGVLFFLLVPSARAQCEGWVTGFGVPGVNGTMNDTLVFDDGSGPKLYVAGNFDAAGDVPAKGLARWDGTQWADVGGSLNGAGSALCIFDDGGGPALWVGGVFTSAGGTPAQNLAKWNGSAWSSPGTGPDLGITCMTVHDDGLGAALFVGGYFHTTAGMQTESIAKWNGVQWSALDLGVFGQVNALASLPFGPINYLYVGGAFEFVGSFYISAFNIARWDGGTWTLVNGGSTTTVGTSLAINDLEVFDDGAGAKLYACGASQRIGPLQNQAIGAWDGSAWSAVPSPNGVTPSNLSDLLVHDSGAGPRLFASGRFSNVSTMARLEAQGWIRYGTTDFWDLPHGQSTIAPTTLCVYDDGTGEQFFAGGRFARNGTLAMENIARFDGAVWRALRTATPTLGVQSEVFALAAHDDGAGTELYAAGHMCYGGNQAATNIARFDGVRWSEVGTGLGQYSNSYDVRALLSFDDGSGPALYAAGRFVVPQLPLDGFGNIARWDGTSWSLVGGGIGTSGMVNALASFDDGAGPALYAAGVFSLFVNGQKRDIARWNGTAWSDVGGGITAGTPSALAAYDDGQGSALYVGGTNLVAAGLAPCGLLKWDGAQWTRVGFELGQRVLSLAVFDDGTGPALYVGGFMTDTGTLPVSALARWNGSSWTSVGGGVTFPGSNGLVLPSVKSMQVVDAGSGPLLFVGGQFDRVGNVSSSGVAAWDGTNWLAMSSGTAIVSALAGADVFGDGSESLFVGGLFGSMGAKPAQNVAEWRACTSGVSYCAGDGSAAPCPCNNLGAGGHGCANSIFASGARLSATGSPSIALDTLTLAASPLPQGPGLFIQGAAQAAGGNGFAFGDGLLCVGGGLTRLAVVFAEAGIARLPRAGIDPALHVLGGAAIGDVRTYQLWFRDAAPTFCSASFFNLTNAVELHWLP